MRKAEECDEQAHDERVQDVVIGGGMPVERLRRGNEHLVRSRLVYRDGLNVGPEDDQKKGSTSAQEERHVPQQTGDHVDRLYHTCIAAIRSATPTQVPGLESAGEANNHRIVSECGVTVDAVLIIGNAPSPVAFDRDGNAD